MDADHSKSPEGLLGVLGHMLSGKSLDLLLAAAAATGKLKSFARKFIKYDNMTETGYIASGSSYISSKKHEQSVYLYIYLLLSFRLNEFPKHISGEGCKSCALFCYDFMQPVNQLFRFALG